MSKTINIEMVSDFACPWCYVGHRRLQRSIELRPGLDTGLNWSPFQLNPEMPREGRNRREYYRNKFGDEGAQSLLETVRAAGEEEGIAFCNEPDAMAPNTLSAHVLMSWASEDEHIDATALAEKLFEAHHVACENIGVPEVLVRIASEAGMDASSVRSKLAAGDDEYEIKGRIQRLAERGVSGVPFFVINEEYGVSGAQSSETLASVFDQVAKANS